jgi:leucyl-tRNA synthetase
VAPSIAEAELERLALDAVDLGGEAPKKVIVRAPKLVNIVL